MEISRRIFSVRKETKLNQADFGKRIGVTRSAICNYENGSRSVGEQVILSICREFNVNEAWLRTGEGNMFLKAPDTTAGQLTKEFGFDEFMQGIICEYLKLNEGQRKVVQNFIRNIAAEIPPEDNSVPVEPERQQNFTEDTRLASLAAKRPEEMTDAEIEAEVQEYRCQLLDEKEAAARSSASGESKRKQA